jgi:hypothetical protein
MGNKTFMTNTGRMRVVQLLLLLLIGRYKFIRNKKFANLLLLFGYSQIKIPNYSPHIRCCHRARKILLVCQYEQRHVLQLLFLGWGKKRIFLGKSFVNHIFLGKSSSASSTKLQKYLTEPITNYSHLQHQHQLLLCITQTLLVYCVYDVYDRIRIRKVTPPIWSN